LGVTSGVSDDAIKSAFRRKALELHRDTSGLEGGPSLEFQEAYDVLSDPERRRIYDRQEHPPARWRPWGPVAETLVRQRAPAEPLRPSDANRNFREIPLAELFERQSPFFDELLERLWIDFASLSRPKAETLESLIVEVVVTREEARFGGRARVKILARATCSVSTGSAQWNFMSAGDAKITARSRWNTTSRARRLLQAPDFVLAEVAVATAGLRRRQESSSRYPSSTASTAAKPSGRRTSAFTCI